MLLGAVTYNILKDWDVEKIIKELEATGFQAVELRTSHAHKVEPTLSPTERAGIKTRFERSKVRLLSYGTVAEFHSPDAAVRARHVSDAKAFIDLAHDTGAWGIKVRPNGLPKEVSPETTIQNIANSLRELAEYGQGKGVEIWVEVHGRETQVPAICAQIMRATKHSNAGLCWNSNPTDVENGSVRKSFELLRPWIKNVHINELAGPYPYRELFRLLRESKYDRYTLCEAQESKEPERFLRWYSALWRELNRA
jgi:sugar phosphate isomerase/epimerase